MLRGMAYTLEAVIGPTSLLTDVGRGLDRGRLASLAQGFSLLPMTRGLAESLSGGSSHDHLSFRLLAAGFAEALAVWSAGSALCYVEA